MQIIECLSVKVQNILNMKLLLANNKGLYEKNYMMIGST
jgi:hypothetical protein